MQVVLASVSGTALIALAARDIFQTLFQPAGHGRASALVARLAVYLEAPRRADLALSEVGSAALERVLASLTKGLVTAREDLVMFPETFYFHSPERRSSLARFLPSLVALSDEIGRVGPSPALQTENAALRIALDELAAVLDREFLRGEGRAAGDVFVTYAKEHQRHEDHTIELPRPR